MGKKKPEEMAKQREIFLKGAAEQGVEEKIATHIFDLMEHFAGYGFNKSHSAAYALLSYQTAWLKAHYPAAFMAAVLSSDMDHTDKVVVLIDECRRMGLEILPPDVNQSDYMFTVAGDRAIRYGLGAIKGVGQGAIESIREARTQHGAFTDLAAFCRRVDLSKANRRTLEALIKAGALDALGPNRATLFAQLPQALQLADQHHRARAAGQEDMFGLAAPVEETAPAADLGPEQPEWDEDIRLAGEKETLGLYLSGHPIARYERDIPYIASGRLGELTGNGEPEAGGSGYTRRGRNVTVVGLVMDVTRRGGRVSITLDDNTGRLEATLFEDSWQQFRHLVSKDTVLVVEGRLGFDEFINGYRLTVRDVKPVEELRGKLLRHIVLHWEQEAQGPEFVTRLQEILAPHRGGHCAVSVVYVNGSASARLDLGAEWRVHPADALLNRLAQWLGPEAVHCHYARPQAEPQAVGA